MPVGIPGLASAVTCRVPVRTLTPSARSSARGSASSRVRRQLFDRQVSGALPQRQLSPGTPIGAAGLTSFGGALARARSWGRRHVRPGALMARRCPDPAVGGTGIRRVSGLLPPWRGPRRGAGRRGPASRRRYGGLSFVSVVRVTSSILLRPDLGVQADECKQETGVQQMATDDAEALRILADKLREMTGPCRAH